MTNLNDPVSRLLEVPRITIGGLRIAVADRETSARHMVEAALARRGSDGPLIVSSANGQVISSCASDSAVRSMFRAADVLHADGMPMVFASWLFCRTPLPERVATTDLFDDVAVRAERQGASFYLLGAAPGVIEETVRCVRQRYPRLDIAGFRDGYFSPSEELGVVAEINAARPDILWISMGVPAEQAFALRHRDRLTEVGLIKTSGGLFDFLAGRHRRAPPWMQAVGLEWFYRILMEPQRLFMRYLTTNPHALFLLTTRTAQPAPVSGPERRQPWRLFVRHLTTDPCELLTLLTRPAVPAPIVWQQRRRRRLQ
jgi:N-acetylglucosaminyldiphosphoundecaprenol N-acetyl-beta-D-mannosaminyltransferase